MNTEALAEPSTDSRTLIQQLDGWRACKETARYKQRAYELVPRGTRQLLDVGCGTGDDVLALAERLGPRASLIGLEKQLELVDEAQRRARSVALNVRFAVGDAHSLPFADDAFDVVRADGVLRYASDPTRVVRELARVLAPGGSLLLHDHEDVVLGRPRSERGAPADDLLALLRRTGLDRVELVDSWSWAPRVRATERGLSLRGVRPTRARERVEYGPA
jgi:ubiquinone/menaquinone biosynthesis C-methylase UbiE